MTYFERPPQTGELPIKEWFKHQSLACLREQLAGATYPGYPSERLWVEDLRELYEPLYLPDGPWETSGGTVPSIRERQLQHLRNCRKDGYGRPLHPWFYDMVADPGIGVVTGKGAYWNWGPNYTADAIVIRHDKSEPEVLLIQRADTGNWALPGGFLDNEEPELTAALREAKEETGLCLETITQKITPVYSGPLADLRVTANAWPETTAFRFDVAAAPQLDDVQGTDDAINVRWLPVSSINEELFGSHRLLIKHALQT